MAVAKTLLRRGGFINTQIARKVGYGSASAFGMRIGISNGPSLDRAAALSADPGLRPGRLAALMTASLLGELAVPTLNKRVLVDEVQDRERVTLGTG